jgi:hypothetical protein
MMLARRRIMMLQDLIDHETGGQTKELRAYCVKNIAAL